MRDANVERLLGGYATNTLTDSERAALFAAALEDQDLFNALQDEEALRDLLGDVVSRSAVERALRQPVAEPRRPWFTRDRQLGLAGAVLGAVGLIFALLPRTVHHDQVEVAVSKPTPSAMQSEVAVARPGGEVSKLDVDVPKPDALNKALPVNMAAAHAPEVRRKSASPQPPLVSRSIPMAGEPAPTQQGTISPPPITSQAAQQQMPQVQETRALDRISDAQQASQSAPTSAPANYRSGPVGYVAASSGAIGAIPYSVLRRGPDGAFARIAPGDELKSGDSVQLILQPPLSGSLRLEEEISGNWKTVFPVGSAGLTVIARRDVVVPYLPIQVNGPRQMRLVLTPATVQGAIALSKAAKLAVNQDKQRLDGKPALNENQDSRRIVTNAIVTNAVVTNVMLIPGKTLLGR